MKTTPKIIRVCLGLICCWLALPLTSVLAADSPAPGIIADGFKAWGAKNASYAFDVWKKGGLLETDPKSAQLVRYFSRIDRTVGNYKSYEVIDSKAVGQSSRIIYLSVNFEHAAVYGRFMVFQTDRGWVVQNMDFSPKPEAIMPWLAFTGQDYTE